MTRTMLAACAACAVAASTTIGAQTPPPPKPQPSTPPMASQTDKDTVTLTGCLKAYDSAAGAPSATTPSAGSTAGKFMLTNVEKDATARTPSTPPAATTATSETGGHYVLIADSGVNLSAHLNHKVRVTGKKSAASMTHNDATRPDPSRPGEPKPDPSKPSAGIMSGEQAHKDMGTITVASVTMISATCPGVTH